MKSFAIDSRKSLSRASSGGSSVCDSGRQHGTVLHLVVVTKMQFRP
jgi:hypothetical protein